MTWSIQDSQKLYNIAGWSEGHFCINDQGELSMKPKGIKRSPDVSLLEVVKEAKEMGLKLPLVIRFHDILKAQVRKLSQTFQKQIKELNYPSRYLGVYPVKVNQMREVLEEVIDSGKSHQLGLEVGSKSELVAALSFKLPNQALLIINGYKDKEIMELACLGQLIGKKVIVVIEQFFELDLLLQVSQKIGITPMIGLRGKLSTQSSGKWSDSSGHQAKFGLSSLEMIKAIELLKDQNALNSCKLFHFHIGSQIPRIQTFKDAFKEGSRIFTELYRMGAPLEFFDIGGGLGVDYQGSNQNREANINYNWKEYSRAVINILKEACELSDIPCPIIVSESGRAIAAHHSCIITNVFGETGHNQWEMTCDDLNTDHPLTRKMIQARELISSSNLRETLNKIEDINTESINAFRLGLLNLEEKAYIENIYWKILSKAQSFLKELHLTDPDIESKLSTKYLCNFSVFQSAPDSWAIGQVLPICPIERLNEEPTQSCTLADITCDSDGKVSQFPIDQSIRSSLPCHSLKENTPYHLGIFMTGAYQDIMGDMHNLFGRLNEVHVYADSTDPKGFYIEEEIIGNNIGDVLQTMQYDLNFLARNIREQVNLNIKKGNIKPRMGINLINSYEDILNKYTYLD